jgi:hypothetical protein
MSSPRRRVFRLGLGWWGGIAGLYLRFDFGYGYVCSGGARSSCGLELWRRYEPLSLLRKVIFEVEKLLI